jgi:hypothetical protein
MIKRLALACVGFGFLADAPAGTGLVTQGTDEAELVTLGGNTRPEANAVNDRGAVPETLALEHMQLQLQRSPEQERAVDAFIEALHDPASPVFHRWLTAEQFGARFGTAEADIEAIETWLSAHGLQVNALYPSRMVIDFSGTAGQLAAAFHTEIHSLEVNGVAHMANMSDPRIPAALAPIVAGIVKLNDFHPARRHRPRPKFTGDCGDGATCYLMAPADLATIYDFNPLFHAATPITGKGQSIAVAEDTDLYSDSDWFKFRWIFGLSVYGSGSLKTIHPPPPSGAARPCTDPGVNPNGDDVVAAILDAEWSSAAAPDAAILVAACDNDSATIDGDAAGDPSTWWISTSTPPPSIISVSYGDLRERRTARPCQRGLLRRCTSRRWPKGISVFVATGDSGPEDCAPNLHGLYGHLWDRRQRLGVDPAQRRRSAGRTSATPFPAPTSLILVVPAPVRPGARRSPTFPEMPWNDTCASERDSRLFAGYAQKLRQEGLSATARAAAPYLLGTGGGEGRPERLRERYAPVDRGRGRRHLPRLGEAKATNSDLYGDAAMTACGTSPTSSMFAADGWTWKPTSTCMCFSDPNNLRRALCQGQPRRMGPGRGRHLLCHANRRRHPGAGEPENGRAAGQPEFCLLPPGGS